MNPIVQTVLDILKKSATAIQGTINVDELLKVLTAAASSGGTVWSMLAMIQAASNTFITDPTVLSEWQSVLSMAAQKNYIGLAFFGVVMAVDLYRRFNQGISVEPSIPLIKNLNDKPVDNVPVVVKQV